MPGAQPAGGSGRRRAGARAALAVAALVAVSAVSPTTSTARTDRPVAPRTGDGTPAKGLAGGGYDQYGGWTGVTRTATGFFRTEQIDGRWWIIDPDGHPFFSHGLNHVVPEGTVDRNGHAAYHEAILAKYGSEDAWADAQVDRFATWGINTLGGWSDTGGFAGKGVPYTVMLGLSGHSAPTGTIADLWDPAWEAQVEAEVTAAAAAHGNDPWLVGYFLDNEVHWAKDWRKEQLDLFLTRPATAPGKQHLVGWLRHRYGGSFEAFAADFQTTATGWDDLDDAVAEKSIGPGAQATKDAWAAELAGRYFSFAHAALKAADPNHLDLGARFIAQLMTPAITRAAGRHVDVVSINWYEATDETEEGVADLGPDFVGTSDTLADIAALAGRPLMITEFGWRAKDSGLPNTFPPFQVVVDTQQDRADRYLNFGNCLANTGYVVGAHWFEAVDEPAIGRFDGEDDNWGMLTEADEEYPLVTDAAARVHAMSYAPITDPDWTPGPCTPQGPQRAVAETTTTTTSPPATTTTTAVAAQGAGAVPGSPTYTG